MPGQTKFSRVKAATIVTLIKARLPKSVAAAQAGITRQTLYNWLKRGEKGERRFAKFARDVAAAEGKTVGQLYARWGAHGQDDWRAIDRLISQFHRPFTDDAPAVNDGQPGLSGGGNTTVVVMGANGPLEKAAFSDPVPKTEAVEPEDDPDLKADASKAFRAADDA